MPIAHCITLFLCSWKQRGYFEQCKTSHLFKAAHHYFSSPSCLGRLLSELDALKIESILCVDTEEREGRENSNNTLLSATPVLLKSRHQWNKEGEEKKEGKKRHEEVVVTLFVFNVEMLKKSCRSTVVVVRWAHTVHDVRSFSQRSLTQKYKEIHITAASAAVRELATDELLVARYEKTQAFLIGN